MRKELCRLQNDDVVLDAVTGKAAEETHLKWLIFRPSVSRLTFECHSAVWDNMTSQLERDNDFFSCRTSGW
jgi:hypothetical protein